MHTIFEKLCETLSGDVMAKAAPERMTPAELVKRLERGEKWAPAQGPTTDADAELMARLLSGGEK